MSHAVFQVVDGKMRQGVAPDGAMLSLGATDIGGRDVAPIVAIDYEQELLLRNGGEWEPWPVKRYDPGDIVWHQDKASIHDYASQD